MLGNKLCPYCGETLERGLVSGPSPMYKEDIRYVGCAECGKTSMLYKNGLVSAIAAPKGAENTMTKVLEKDIAKAFASDKTEKVFSYDIKSRVNLNNKIKIDKSEGEDKMDTNFIEELMRNGGVMRIPVDSKEGASLLKALEKNADHIEEDSMGELFKKVCEDILNQIKAQDKKQEVKKEEPKVETLTIKTEERKSYVLIDEYNETYTYLNVTQEELLAKMEEDGHEEEEYDNMNLYELKNPLKFSVKKSITIE